MNAEPQQPLFRAEAMEAKRARLEGEIVLTQPVQVQGLVLVLFALIAALGAWISLGQYSRTETARGILVTDESSAKIVALRLGQVTELLVKEGDLVRPGQRLASIRVEQTGETGGSAVGESLAAVEARRRGILLVPLGHSSVGASAARRRARRTALGPGTMNIRTRPAERQVREYNSRPRWIIMSVIYLKYLPKAALVGLIVGLFAVFLDSVVFDLTGLEPWHVGSAAGVMATLSWLHASGRLKNQSSRP